MRRYTSLGSEGGINGGNYVKEEPDYGKRPMAKMMHDEAEDLGLIKDWDGGTGTRPNLENQ